jgi:hypothetical protein
VASDTKVVAQTCPDICPICAADTRVIDSRPTKDAIRRRRVCSADQGHRFTTFERVHDEEADRAALEALRLNPVELETIERVLTRAFTRLRRLGGKS